MNATCQDCGAPVSRRRALRCRACAARARPTSFDSDSARVAALAKRDQDRENRRLADLMRAAAKT